MSLLNGPQMVVVGANGQLGRATQERFPDAQYFGSGDLDITSPDSLRAISWKGVEVILNAAAYTNVDGAETAEGRTAAWRVNAEGVRNLASVAVEHGLTLVHVSSEYVFDGTEQIHTEDEPFSPLSSYGATKAAGDLAASLADRHYILRISWAIGEGHNFVRTMMNLANRDISPQVVNDQIGRLTFMPEVTGALEYLITAGAEYGTYNMTASGQPASWAHITEAVFEALGRHDLEVTGVTTDAFYEGKEGIAPRPAQSTLDLTKISNAGFAPQDWQESLKEYIEKELSK